MDEPKSSGFLVISTNGGTESLYAGQQDADKMQYYLNYLMFFLGQSVSFTPPVILVILSSGNYLCVIVTEVGLDKGLNLMSMEIHKTSLPLSAVIAHSWV